MKDKKYLIDTSVILDNPHNLVALYQNGSNELYISDVVLAELDTKLCSVKFEADQSYINNIDEDMTIPETIGMIHNYWNQKKSDTPITEILLQGEVGVVRQL